MAGEQGSPLAYRESNLSILVYPVPLRSIIFFNTILTLLASTQSADNMFHLFTVLCENVLISTNLVYAASANVTSCPLVLSSLTENKIFLSVFSYPLNIINTKIDLISSQSPGL